MKKVAVGMSGGVDSSVTAALLKEQGYDVTGVFIEAYNEPGCRTDQDKKDALKVAVQLGIKFETLDVREEYKKRVVAYFLETYKRGATPNPDVVCNREVKFGIFYEWAMEHDFDSVATGHYCRKAAIINNQIPKIKQISIFNNTKDTLLIQRAVDLRKDQSYFLWQISQVHLGNILWPLGDKKKEWVREYATQLALPNADKPDSMGVCMMGELNLRQFLHDKLGEKQGDVIWNGKVVGVHSGLWFYTIGQRGGFQIDKNTLKKRGYSPENLEPLYVLGKNKDRNQLVIGTKDQVLTDSWPLINGHMKVDPALLQRLIREQKLFVRIRNLGELSLIDELVTSDKTWTIRTQEKIFGVAEGQAAVLYARLGNAGDEAIVAGGEIGVDMQ